MINGNRAERVAGNQILETWEVKRMETEKFEKNVETKEENDLLVDQIKALNPGTTIKGYLSLFKSQ